ncbi:hypothetical protein [Bdellovibrio sp. ZAP7]|uniref:hypothetical protein n=1 Tax=Bdellovibrio sp. ZAP7 TaxID=2231053 RepID=UPI00115BFE5D|nr:hypothetical protein [Bdellovibrio sp. ZAP7]
MMKSLLSVLALSAISVIAHADEGKMPSPPFKSDYGKYEITGCAGQTFQLDCKLKSVTIGAANPDTNPKGKGPSVGFVFKSETDAIVKSDIWLSASDKYEEEDDKHTLTTDKTKNTTNWSEESQEITLDKSDAKEWTLTFVVNRENLGKKIKRQIEFKIKKK